MENKRPTIVLVLRSGGDFKFRDVELISRHINGKWTSLPRPRIICLWDKASDAYSMEGMEVLPLKTELRGTWSRMQLYSPEMEQYRPFLYVDLDTIVVKSIENIFDLVRNPNHFITLEDFWQPRQMATGLVWFPANSEKIKDVWKAWNKGTQVQGFRMDTFLRKVIQPDIYWQQLTDTIYDFKHSSGKVLTILPNNASMVCLHGKPRIFDVAESSMTIGWIQDYVDQEFSKPLEKRRVTVIIPYRVDRGWLKEAIESVPLDVQLLVSQGEGNWPANFNKVLEQAEGKFIKYLHEDDMLTPNCIEDSVRALEEQNVDFIHGNAIEIQSGSDKMVKWVTKVQYPTLQDLLVKNVIHSATTMYRRDVFTKVGSFDESLNTAEEYEFNLRCLYAGLKIGYCNSFLAIYRRHPKQKVRIIPAADRKKEREMVQHKYIIV